MAATPTAVPYQKGTKLDLLVRETYVGDISPSEPVTVTIHKLLSITTSAVLDVTMPNPHGSPTHFVLKLYDRQFGTFLRSNVRGQVVPHTQEIEAAFRTFVMKGTMLAFLEWLEDTNKTRDMPMKPRHFLDAADNGPVKFEAALWAECHENFERETQAYTRLRDLQGKSIPRMLAHVCLAATDNEPVDALKEMSPELVPYLEVNGILLERIDGYELEDITASPLAPPTHEWQQIVQSAVNLAHDINRRGIVMQDCDPRNVVVHRVSQTPHFVDLAECRFRDEMEKYWHEWEWDDDEDWDPEIEYWKFVDDYDNPKDIGAPMVTRAKRERGVDLQVEYPTCKALISHIRHTKAEVARKW
ncbi:hypothetical protein L209DRAFT_731505 [Thermothelomyces heterothallicus CBS 203.75]